LLYLIGQCMGRIYRNTVARVYAGSFDMLEYARDQDLLAVTDTVDFSFHSVDIFIDQDRMLCRQVDSHPHVFLQRPVIVHYLHSPAAQHI